METTMETMVEEELGMILRGEIVMEIMEKILMEKTMVEEVMDVEV